jgi:predicted glycosyltransferase
MKVYAVLRGFPGLGRVIAGFELLKHLENNYDAIVKVSTYFQGDSYINTKGYSSSIEVDEKDISSVGIISVSKSGEKIIEDIVSFNPDIVIIDGEPILLQNLKISYPNLFIVSLLNPFDVNNPHNQKSSQDFFSYMYSYADLSIVHGLWEENKPNNFKNYLSINSIIRDSIHTISLSKNSNSIVCLLGGGSKSVNSGFTSGTIEIAKQVIDLAISNEELDFTIYTSDEIIKNKITNHINAKDIDIKNLKVVGSITDEREIYSKARLVIARAGRNTISELLTLNMPSIIIPTTANFRGSEQLNNCTRIEYFDFPNIKAHYLDSGSGVLNQKMLQLFNASSNKNNKAYKPGNTRAVEAILNMFDSHTSGKIIEIETNVN